MKIILLSTSKLLCSQWQIYLSQISSISQYLSHKKIPITLEIQHAPLSSITGTKFPTAIVSPGNSLSYMNGGYDLAIANLISSVGEIEMKMGVRYLPPGNPRKIQFNDHELSSEARELGIKYLFHIPTMRVPRALDLTKTEASRLVFDLTWSILSLCDSINENIDTLVLPGFGTGYGRLDERVVAEAMIAAITLRYSSLDEREKCSVVLLYLQEDPTLLGHKRIEFMDFKQLIQHIDSNSSIISTAS